MVYTFRLSVYSDKILLVAVFLVQRAVLVSYIQESFEVNDYTSFEHFLFDQWSDPVWLSL